MILFSIVPLVISSNNVAYFYKFSSHYHRVKGSWQKLFVILQNYELHFHNDHKTKDSPGAKPLCVFSLMHSTTSLYTKEKKKNVFQVGCWFLVGHL